MSRKFRWFLLAACAFVVVMNAREALELLSGGPELGGASPERARVTAAPGARERLRPDSDARPLDVDELARGERPEQ